MEERISVYGLWQAIARDCIYGSGDIAASVASYICVRNKISIEVTFRGARETLINDGLPVVHKALTMCEALERAYQNSHDCDQEWKAKQREIDAELLVISMLLAGLKTSTKQFPVFDPYSHDHFSLVEFAGFDDVSKQDLADFLSSYSLPLPDKLYPDSISSTGALCRSTNISNSDWSRTYVLSDLLSYCKNHVATSSMYDTLANSDDNVFVRKGDYFKITYNAINVHVKSSKGLEIFQSLIRNEGSVVGLNNLLIDVYGDKTFAEYAAEHPHIEIGDMSITMSPDDVAYKQKRDKIMAACSRAFMALKKQHPQLERHLRLAISFRDGFRYHPDRKVVPPWKL